MDKVTLQNTGSIPLAIPKCPAIAAGSVGEVDANKFERFKNNPTVKNWLSSGVLVILDGAESPVETPDAPKGKAPAAQPSGRLSDEQISDILAGSAADAGAALSGANAATLARAIELEGEDKARKGLTADLTELLEKWTGTDNG